MGRISVESATRRVDITANKEGIISSNSGTTNDARGADPDPDLLDAFLSPPARECKFGRLLREMGDANAAATLEAFRRGANPNGIAQTLVRKGLAEPSLQRITVARHLRGECSCPK